ncbi:glycerol-3-phosphate 1-O-acyltransferase PlsY [Peijinzhouia sedimentorum]|tara:strand:- start:594 stop:1226 length:633 start_codon:yes stop_codon:yes gene_type:complete
MLIYIFCVLAAYLLGSIPTSVWVGRIWFGLDIREHGSGNAGATNTFRVLGKKAGIFVMLVDILKGLLAATVALILLRQGIIESEMLILWKLILGIIAIIGHILPVFAGFRGGKGVATLAGMMMGVQWEITLICVFIFLITLLLSNYVSLSSMVASLSFPLLVVLVPGFQQDNLILPIFGFALFVAVVFTHRKNIKRLIRGDENKTYLIKK